MTYNKSGTNPQGQVTVTITSCNKPNGEIEANCDQNTPQKWHKYFIKSNSISELTLIAGGSASFGSKTNVYEQLADGSKTGLDGGGTMQLVFTPYTKQMPAGMFTSTAPGTSTGVCNNQSGCASVVIYRSSGAGGGVWYSSAWGQAPPNTAPRTYLKKVAPGGNVVVQ